LDIGGQHLAKRTMTMFSQNIITTLCGIDTSKAEEQCNNDDDDDDNDTDILNEAIEAPNDSDDHEA